MSSEAELSALSAPPVCDDMRATGIWNSAWDTFAQLGPVRAEKFMAMRMHPVLSDALEPKLVEFIAIAVDVACTRLARAATSAGRSNLAPRKRKSRLCSR